MRKIFSICLALLMLVTMTSGLGVTVAATDTVDLAKTSETGTPHGYTPGLVAWYDGEQNTRAGAQQDTTVWEDLISGYDLPVTVNDKNHFTGEGFLLDSQKNYFPQEICSLVNGKAFTVEIRFGDFTAIGASFATFMNSDNDHFALFRRNANDVIEFKFAANAASSRPTVSNGLQTLQNALISVTYQVGGDCIIYINGEEAASVACPSEMGADTLFMGHSEDSKAFRALYKSIRFYDRALNASEVARNAAVDGYKKVTDLYVADGLVSLYSGISNTRDGYRADAAVWEDLISGYDIPLTINAKNYFTREGLHLDTVRHHFGKEIVDLVNSSAFTVEMYLGDLVSLGTDYNTFINSSNDAFSLFRRKSNDVLEFKYASNAPGERPTVPDGLGTFDNSLIAITYKVGGKVTVYVDGIKAAEASVPKAMGANDLFFGHDQTSRNYETTFRALRFYDRALSDEEIKSNAMADGAWNTVAETQANPGFISVAQARTPVAGDIALVRRMHSAKELKEVASALASSSKTTTAPAAVILTINQKLEVLDEAGKAFSTVSEVLSTLEYKVLPVFVLDSTATADALVKFLKEIRFADAFFMSADPALIKYARDVMPAVRGVIDYTETYKDAKTLTQAQCVDIRKSMKANNGTIALLPQSAARQDVVQYLYDSIVNVWVQARDASDIATCMDALLSGAVGVVSDHTQALYTAACTLNQGAMTRVPLNIGHRGLPSSYPENTVEGSLAAYAAGADVIEIDIYLTTDNRIVIMHDGTSARTCDKALPIEGSTLAQLKELYVNRGFENDSSKNSYRIPTLEEYLQAFKGKDCRLFIEIKSSKPELVPIMKQLIDEYDMYDQCAVITFVESQMANMRKYYPEMSVGALCSGLMGEGNADSDMRNVMNFIGKYNATLNPSSGGYGENAIRAALIRGVGVYPWTFDGSSYNNYFMWGYSGLTGNSANTLSRLPKRLWLTTEIPDMVMVGESLTLSGKVMTYNRAEADAAGKWQVIILDGASLVQVNGSELTFTGIGDVTFMVSYTNSRTIRYTLYTQPVTIHVDKVERPPVETEPVTQPETEPETDPVTPSTEAPTEPFSADITDEPATGDVPAPQGGCSSSVGMSLGVILLAVCTALSAFMASKKKL